MLQYFCIHPRFCPNWGKDFGWGSQESSYLDELAYFMTILLLLVITEALACTQTPEKYSHYKPKDRNGS